jgi:hypothetical protein
MEPLDVVWPIFVCSKHEALKPSSDDAVVHAISAGKCPACLGEALEARRYELGGKQSSWLRCPCCGTDWSTPVTSGRGWIGLGWIPRAMLIDQGLVVEKV